jgi:hypothetical protein
VHVIVMQVWRVVVVVLQALVLVVVGVLAKKWRIMGVIVMTVVVAVRMIVNEGFVHVRVTVPLRQVQPQAAKEEQPGQDYHARVGLVPVAERPAKRRAYERRDREDRARASGTHAPLRPQIQAQAQPVTRRATDYQE